MTTKTMARRDVLGRRQLELIRSDLERQYARFHASDMRQFAVADALRRIEEGTYGVCERCREPIAYERLSVMPETRHCMTCGPRA
jgi:RNA polymerase-binding transcription factor DksA